MILTKKQTHKQNIKMEFLTIYCFVFLLVFFNREVHFKLMRIRMSSL